MIFMRIKECLLMKNIDHPNIIKILDYHISKSENKIYMVLEKAEGLTLL